MPDLVLRHKLKKVLDQGIRRDVEHIAAFIGRPNEERKIEAILVIYDSGWNP